MSNQKGFTGFEVALLMVLMATITMVPFIREGRQQAEFNQQQAVEQQVEIDKLKKELEEQE